MGKFCIVYFLLVFQSLFGQDGLENAVMSFQKSIPTEESIWSAKHSYLLVGANRFMEYRQSSGLIHFELFDNKPRFTPGERKSWKLRGVNYKPVSIIQSERLNYQGVKLDKIKSIENKKRVETYSSESYSKDAVLVLKAFLNFGPLSKGMQNFFFVEKDNKYVNKEWIRYKFNSKESVKKTDNPLSIQGYVYLGRETGVMERVEGFMVDFNPMEHGNVERFNLQANYSYDFTLEFENTILKSIETIKIWKREGGSGRIAPRPNSSENKVTEYERLVFVHKTNMSKIPSFKFDLSTIFEKSSEVLRNNFGFSEEQACKEPFPCKYVPAYSDLVSYSKKELGYVYDKSREMSPADNDYLENALLQIFSIH